MTDKSEPVQQTLICARPGPQLGGWGFDREALKAAADNIHYFWDESLDALVWRGREDERLGRLHYTKAYRYLGDPVPSIVACTASADAEPMTLNEGFDTWWENHGQFNVRGLPQTGDRVKELMKLAYEVGAERRHLTSVNTREGVASAQSTKWKDPLVEPAPRGVTIQILTASGRQISGQWIPNTPFFIAWAPLMKTPDWAKERMSLAYRDTPRIAGSTPVVHYSYRPLKPGEVWNDSSAD